MVLLDGLCLVIGRFHFIKFIPRKKTVPFQYLSLKGHTGDVTNLICYILDITITVGVPPKYKLLPPGYKPSPEIHEKKG